MSLDFRLALLGSPLRESLAETSSDFYKDWDSFRSQLSQQTYDVIVFNDLAVSSQNLNQLLDLGYRFILLSQDCLATPQVRSRKLISFSDEADLIKKIKSTQKKVNLLKLKRERMFLKKSLDILTDFSSQVVSVGKDLFIAETRRFLEESLRLKKAHWLDVQSQIPNVPPILKVRQEVENLVVDQSELLQALDGCVKEMYRGDQVQIWSHRSGSYFAFLWLNLLDGPQCLLLEGLKPLPLSWSRDFLEKLTLILNRRWHLSLSVTHAQTQVYKDSLTELYNQRFLNEVLAKKIEENRRYQTPFSVLFIDVDHFKRVNDSLGHMVGSGVLIALGQLLNKQIRTSDFAFRYGGDEFIIILSHTEGNDAVMVAERIRKTIEEEKFHIQGIEVAITVSIGLAFYPHHAKSAQEIIRIADEAMYYGKNKSRNVVYKAS